MEKEQITSLLLKGKLSFDGELHPYPIDIKEFIEEEVRYVGPFEYGRNVVFEIVGYDEDGDDHVTIGVIIGRFFNLLQMDDDGKDHDELVDDIDQYTWEMYENTIGSDNNPCYGNMFAIDVLWIDEEYRNMKLGSAAILLLEEALRVQFNMLVSVFTLSPTVFVKEGEGNSETDYKEIKLKIEKFWRTLGFENTDNKEYMYFNTDYNMLHLYKKNIKK